MKKLFFSDIPSVRLEFHRANWCSYCKAVEQTVFPLLKAVGWTIGPEPTNHIQVRDWGDLQPFTMPMWVKVKGDSIEGFKIGVLKPQEIGEFCK